MSSNIKIQRICQLCGKEFTAKTTVTQYCGDACAKRAYKARVKAQKIEVSHAEKKAKKEKPMQDLKEKAFLSLADACKLLGLSRWTLWRAIKHKKLKSAKIGRSRLIKRSDIDNLFEQEIPILEIKEKPQPTYALKDCYLLAEVQVIYGISDKALSEVIKRNNIPKIRNGIFAYVPKAPIDSIFKPQSKTK